MSNYLKSAKEADTKFSVLVAETSPHQTGEVMASKLSKSGIKSTLISDASVFAYMSKVNKLVIGCHAVMADGGLITQSGIEMAVHAAKTFSVPVIVVAPWYKLTPLYPFDSKTFNELLSPELIYHL